MQTEIDATDQFRQEVRDALSTLNVSASALSLRAGLGVNFVNQLLTAGASPTLRNVGKIRAAIGSYADGDDAA